MEMQTRQPGQYMETKRNLLTLVKV